MLHHKFPAFTAGQFTRMLFFWMKTQNDLRDLVSYVAALNWIKICMPIAHVIVIASAWAADKVYLYFSLSTYDVRPFRRLRPSNAALNYKFLLLFIHVLWSCAAFYCENKRTASKIKSFANRTCNCLIFMHMLHVTIMYRIEQHWATNQLNEQLSNYRLMA